MKIVFIKIWNYGWLAKSEDDPNFHPIVFTDNYLLIDETKKVEFPPHHCESNYSASGVMESFSSKYQFGNPIKEAMLENAELKIEVKVNKEVRNQIISELMTKFEKEQG